MTTFAAKNKWRAVLLLEAKLILVVFLISLLYENAHLPLYANFGGSSLAYKLYAAAHCAFGDLTPFLIGYHLVALFFHSLSWPVSSRWKTGFAALLLFTLAYGATAEVIYVHLLKAWEYKPTMPIVPLLNIGLTPFIQWPIVAPISFFAFRALAFKKMKSSLGAQL